MNWFNFDTRKVAFWVIAALLPFVSLQIEQKPRSTNWIQNPAAELAGATQRLFFAFSDEVRGTARLYLNLIDLKKQAQAIADENALLKSQILQFDEVRRENARLVALLDFQARTKMQLVAARVVGFDLFSEHATVRINKGTHHGLKDGMAVMSLHGAVGHVYQTQAFSSQVLLLTDRYSVVDGIIARSRARGIVEGRGTGEAHFQYVEKSEDIQKDDLIVTSGLDNIFPKGLPIATVLGVERKTFSSSLKVAVKPVVEPTRLEEIFVITNAAEQDLSPSIAPEP